MINKRLTAVFGIFLILAVFAGFKVYKAYSQKVSQKEPEIHLHAGFAVFENGKKVDFSDIKYMNVEPCTLHKSESKETPEHNQLEKAHLHDGVGDVVHVHREGAKWSDLFTNIGYPIDYSKVTAYVNGEKVDDIKDFPIKAYDSVVFFVGSTEELPLVQGITLDHIKEVESKSESCGGS
jgi:hypothetical protein